MELITEIVRGNNECDALLLALYSVGGNMKLILNASQTPELPKIAFATVLSTYKM